MINKFFIDFAKKISIREVLAHYDIKVPDSGMICCINPEHNDKTPSMHIYEDSNIAHCFGKCQKGYDTIEIVRTLEDKSFEDAVMHLYTLFSSSMILTETTEKKDDFRLYKEMNEDLRRIYNDNYIDKEKKERLLAMMSLIDLHAENNLLILKIYKNIMEIDNAV